MALGVNIVAHKRGVFKTWNYVNSCEKTNLIISSLASFQLDCHSFMFSYLAQMYSLHGS